MTPHAVTADKAAARASPTTASSRRSARVAVACLYTCPRHDASSSCIAARQSTLVTGRTARGLLYVPGNARSAGGWITRGIEQTEDRRGRRTVLYADGDAGDTGPQVIPLDAQRTGGARWSSKTSEGR